MKYYAMKYYAVILLITLVCIISFKGIQTDTFTNDISYNDSKYIHDFRRNKVNMNSVFSKEDEDKKDYKQNWEYKVPEKDADTETENSENNYTPAPFDYEKIFNEFE